MQDIFNIYKFIKDENLHSVCFMFLYLIPFIVQKKITIVVF